MAPLAEHFRGNLPQGIYTFSGSFFKMSQTGSLSGITKYDLQLYAAPEPPVWWNGLTLESSASHDPFFLRTKNRYSQALTRFISELQNVRVELMIRSRFCSLLALCLTAAVSDQSALRKAFPRSLCPAQACDRDAFNAASGS